MPKLIPTIYEIRISLRYVSPEIWRSFQIVSSTTLPELHAIIQIVMGWWDSHLHEFQQDDVRYGEPDPDWDDEAPIDELDVCVSALISKAGDEFEYLYDFGDGWHHQLVLEAIYPLEEESVTPICIGGRRACPPDDVGGVGGYQDFVEAILDETDEMHDQYLTWIGGSFDPDAFNINKVNVLLGRGTVPNA